MSNAEKLRLRNRIKIEESMARIALMFFWMMIGIGLLIIAGAIASKDQLGLSAASPPAPTPSDSPTCPASARAATT